MTQDAGFIAPDWSLPTRVRALVTTRAGGVSLPPYASFNLGDHVGDDPSAVARNRARLRASLPAEPTWLAQVHGIVVADANEASGVPEADAVVARGSGAVCAVLTADCLPVLFCNRAGTEVAAAHAGWRGLCDGVLEATVACFADKPENILAWLGPAIGPEAFEVGPEVRDAFIIKDGKAEDAFRPVGEKYFADIYRLARQRLANVGVTQIFGGDRCTLSEKDDFFSYRRDKMTGRMASFIWLR